MLKFMTVPAEKIVLGKNVRQSEDAEADRELLQSIKEYGILQPLGVTPDGDLYKLIFAFRRFLMGLEAKVKEFPVVVLPPGMDETGYMLLQWTENSARLDVKDWEQSDRCGELFKLNPSWTQADLAGRMGFSPKTICQLIGGGSQGRNRRGAGAVCQAVPQRQQPGTGGQDQDRPGQRCDGGVLCQGAGAVD